VVVVVVVVLRWDSALPSCFILPSRVVSFFTFSTEKISCLFLLTCKVSAEKFAVKLIETPLFSIYFFSFVALRTFSLLFTLDS
jgi:hypothetical protein